MLVVDASAVVELLLGRAAAGDVERHVVAHDYLLHAPHLLDVEVLSALGRVVATDQATSERGAEALADLGDLPIERYPHGPLMLRAWEMRDNLPAYDAAYLTLAELLREDGAALLTADARFAHAARQQGRADVLLVGA
jgi:predicted nucleic acid-binding protein